MYASHAYSAVSDLRKAKGGKTHSDSHKGVNYN